MYKSRLTTYTDYNRATQSLRQPGSAMKPIVYLAAFRQGAFDLDTLVPDEPISVAMSPDRPVKWIANYDNQFKGMIPARQALAESRNAVAVWMVQQIGIDSLLQTAQNVGIRTKLQPYDTHGSRSIRSHVTGTRKRLSVHGQRYPCGAVRD